MRNNWFKYILTVSLLVIYINRALFVATPGIEFSSTHLGSSNEINSLLEVVINLAGGDNHLDEDGDTPESYDAAKTIQPVIGHEMCTSITCPCITVPQNFYLTNELMLSLNIYRNIDHPPEQV